MSRAFDDTETRWNAGRVDRWHAHPTIHKQTVADHTYGVVQWLTFIVPKDMLTTRLILATLNHDVAEIFTGDIPFTAKRMYPELKAVLERVEEDIHQQVGASCLLLPWEQDALKFADLTDMGFYAVREHTLGNAFMTIVLDNVIAELDRIGNRMKAISTDHMGIIQNYFIKERGTWEKQTTNK